MYLLLRVGQRTAATCGITVVRNSLEERTVGAMRDIRICHVFLSNCTMKSAAYARILASYAMMYLWVSNSASNAPEKDVHL